MSDHIHILMATYNGAAHLAAQLDSFRAQTHTRWTLWVSDDGSSDDTPRILRRFQHEVPQEVRILTGPRSGVAANFLSLLCHPELPAGYVALSDQDDVWYPIKLSRALAQLEKRTTEVALYGSRSDIGTSPDRPRRPSPLHSREPGFENALIQTLAGGNSMVLSPQALDRIRQAGTAVTPAFHDWWAYQLISGTGGQVIYDETPTLLYRQHADNHWGRNRGIGARYTRLKTIFSGQFQAWISLNLDALRQCRGLLTPENQTRLEAFETLRRLRGLQALRQWHRIGLYRQSRAETAVMSIASMVGRL